MAKTEKKTETETKKTKQPPRLVIMGDDPVATRVAGWYLNELKKAGREDDVKKVQDFIEESRAYEQ